MTAWQLMAVLALVSVVDPVSSAQDDCCSGLYDMSGGPPPGSLLREYTSTATGLRVARVDD